MGFRSLGENVLISEKASIYGASRISLGSNVRIDDFAMLSAGEEGIEVGNFVHIAFGASLIGKCLMRLDDYVGISAKVAVYSSTDDYCEGYLTNPTVHDDYKKVFHAPTIFEKHALIGAGSVVLPGVTVHEGAACGALTLINRDVEPYALVVGSPFKKVRERSKTRMQSLESLHKQEYPRK
jgi:galactoside O-acetyltransferase